MIVLKEVKSSVDYHLASVLFTAYATQLGVDLGFQNFDEEITTIEKQYARPKGTIYIAYNDQDLPLGCFGIRPLDGGLCELKRMYVKKEARGNGLGKQLVSKAIETAKVLGYEKMRLDTLPSMLSAIELYKKMGFYEIPPYRFNPIEGTLYFEITLNSETKSVGYHCKI